MHRTTIAGLLLCCGAASFWACASDKSPPTAQSFPPATPGVRMSIAAPTCEPKTHPNGVIDTITTPPSFGIAVREDGLAYFTELFNGGVGITAYVTNQGSQNVGVIDVPTAQQVATIFTPAGSPLVVRVSPDGTRLFI